jgi:TorA maturation chaperone TorD/DNA-binding transcriptional regulator YdaS (Cro superfamily)
MRDQGLEQAIAAIGSASALARALNISQPTVSNWQRIPAERVAAVEAATGLSRDILRPDLFDESAKPAEVDEIDQLRAHEYALLAALLGRAPKGQVLKVIAGLKGDASPLGMAHISLADAASKASQDAIQREYFNLFIGVGRGELLPYASYYLTGFLNDRPLAKLRDALGHLGLERTEAYGDPEDHIATLCEVMSGLCAGKFDAPKGADRAFFEAHIEPWAARFFADLEMASGADFHKSVGQLGRMFINVETQAFALEERSNAAA